MKYDREKALRKDIRQLTKLANEAVRKKDTNAFVNASRARDAAHATLLELLAGKTPEPTALGPSDVRAKQILSRMAWHGYWPTDEERRLLVALDCIFDKEPSPLDAPISERERLETIVKLFSDVQALANDANADNKIKPN
jgi:hypothetical protein